MLSERFSRLFARLIDRWIEYQDAPRDPARVTELAAARIALDEVRSEIRTERLEPYHTPVLDGPRVAVSPDDLARLRINAIGLEGAA